MRPLPIVSIRENSLARVGQSCRRPRLARQMFGPLFVCVLLFSNVANAQGTAEELRAAAVQRLHWTGLYLPEIEISIGKDNVATVSGMVSSDVVKADDTALEFTEIDGTVTLVGRVANGQQSCS